MDELNLYIESKLSKNTYSYYFSKKYADFAGLHIAFFSCVLLAFLFSRDLKKDIYELLHTKPVSATGYVWGKFVGGILSLILATVIMTIIFTVFSQYNPLQTGLAENAGTMFCAAFLYVTPTVFIITGI